MLGVSSILLPFKGGILVDHHAGWQLIPLATKQGRVVIELAGLKSLAVRPPECFWDPPTFRRPGQNLPARRHRYWDSRV